MATRELLVSVRIPQEIQEDLQHYQDRQNADSIASAVEMILRDFFQTASGSRSAAAASSSIKTNSVVEHSIASISEEPEDEPCEVLTSFLSSDVL